MALRYANVLKVCLYTSAISTLLPMGSILCLIGLVILYWADKYLLFRRMVCKNYISTILSKKMLEYLHLSSVFFSIGNCITLIFPLYDNSDEKFEYNIKVKNKVLVPIIYNYLLYIEFWILFDISIRSCISYMFSLYTF